MFSIKELKVSRKYGIVHFGSELAPKLPPSALRMRLSSLCEQSEVLSSLNLTLKHSQSFKRFFQLKISEFLFLFEGSLMATKKHVGCVI